VILSRLPFFSGDSILSFFSALSGFSMLLRLTDTPLTVMGPLLMALIPFTLLSAEATESRSDDELLSFSCINEESTPAGSRKVGVATIDQRSLAPPLLPETSSVTSFSETVASEATAEAIPALKALSSSALLERAS
jgi:hypothetical protein